MFSWRSVLLWIVVLVLTTTLTWQIVDAADSQISDPPLAAVTVSSVSTSSSSTPTTAATTSTSTEAPTTTTPDPTSTTGDQPSATTPTTVPGTATTTSTTEQTSTTSSGQWSVKTIDSDGGSISVRYRPGEVELVTATPKSGFVTEVEEAGPPRVRVEFSSDDTEFEIRVEWKNGELDIDIDES